MITGDLAHHPAQVDETDWCSRIRHRPSDSSESRKRLMELLESEGATGAFCHFPEPFGKLVRLNGKRVFQAL